MNLQLLSAQKQLALMKELLGDISEATQEIGAGSMAQSMKTDWFHVLQYLQ